MNKFLFFIFILLGFCCYSQNDALKFKNTNSVVCEVKSLINDVNTRKTSLSDIDFNLNYDNQPTLVGNEFDHVLNRNFARN